MRLILIGMKGCGKTTVGQLLAQQLNIPFLDSDHEVEKLHLYQSGEGLSFRQIFQQYGRSYFQGLETAVLHTLLEQPGDFVLATGGGLPLNPINHPLLIQAGILIYLQVAPDILLTRILANGTPPFFPYPDDPSRSLSELLAQRHPIYQQLAQLTLTLHHQTPHQITQQVIQELQVGDW